MRTMARFALANPAMTWVGSRMVRRASVDWDRVRRSVVPAVAPAAVAGIGIVLVMSRSLMSEHPQRVALQVVVVGVPVIGGVFARRSPGTRRFGTALVAVGLIGALALLARSPFSVPYSVGRVIGWLVAPLAVYLMLILPQGRLAPGRERALFGAVVILVGLLYVGSALFVETYPRQPPWASCRADCPPNAFLLVHDVPAITSSVIERVRETLAILLLGAVSLLLVQRVRSASAPRRRTVAPVAAAGLVATLLLAAFLVVRQAAPRASVLEPLGVLWALSIPAIAAAFLVGLVRRRVLIGSVLGRLRERRSITCAD